jgi:hypothetical protein
MGKATQVRDFHHLATHGIEQSRLGARFELSRNDRDGHEAV